MSYIGYVPAAKPLTSADITDSVVTSAKIVDGTIAIADLSATGTPSSTTFLRGDNTWGSAGATAGQVIQVLGATDSTSRSVTSWTSWVTASNTLSVTITPSATANKILILASVSLATYTDSGQAAFTIFRNGSTNLGDATYGMKYVGRYDVYDQYNQFSVSYLDSPSTTSATTYQVYFKGNPQIYINNSGSKGSIVCLEVKG